MPLFNPININSEANVTGCNRTTVTPPATITDDKEIIAANPNRKGLSLWNLSTGTVKIEKGAAATTTSFVADIGPGGYYEFPKPIWQGEVRGLWSAAGGVGMLVREDI